MAKLMQKLQESMKSKVGEIELFGTKVHKFRFHIARPGAVEVALIFKELLAADSSLHFRTCSTQCLKRASNLVFCSLFRIGHLHFCCFVWTVAVKRSCVFESG